MAGKYLVEPDSGFIKEIGGRGGRSLKSVFSVLPVRWPVRFPRKINLSQKGNDCGVLGIKGSTCCK